MNRLLVSVADDRVQIDILPGCLSVLLALPTAETFLQSLQVCIEQATWNAADFVPVDLTGKAS